MSTVIDSSVSIAKSITSSLSASQVSLSEQTPVTAAGICDEQLVELTYTDRELTLLLFNASTNKSYLLEKYRGNIRKTTSGLTTMVQLINSGTFTTFQDNDVRHVIFADKSFSCPALLSLHFTNSIQFPFFSSSPLLFLSFTSRLFFASMLWHSSRCLLFLGLYRIYCLKLAKTPLSSTRTQKRTSIRFTSDCYNTRFGD